MQAQFNHAINNNYPIEDQDMYNSLTFQQNSLAENNDNNNNNIFGHNPISRAEFATAEDYSRGGYLYRGNKKNDSFDDSRDHIFSQDDQD